MLKIKKYIYNFFADSSRSKNAVQNVALSLFAKAISIIAPLLLIPLTIDYINPERYGIWLAITSILIWVSVFDLGLGNGLRNKLSEAIANNDTTKANRYVSTSYFVIGSIVFLVFVLFSLLNTFFIDWSRLLNIDSSYKNELGIVAFVVFAFFSLNLIVNLFGVILTANQKIGYSALISGVGQLLSLIVIYILTKVSDGSLIKLALFFSGVPTLFMLVVSTYSFLFTKYKVFQPKLKNVRMSLMKDIVSLGFQFFVIQICLLLIFQLINIVLSREIGPVSVTQYNVSSRYFGIINTMIAVVVAPYWSAFTEAYVKNEINWMKSTLKKLELVWGLFVVTGVLLLIGSPYFFKIWIHDSVEIPFVLSLSILVFHLIQSLSTIYIYLINGIGTIRLQLLIYLLFSILSWPLLVYSVRLVGVCGALISPSLALITQIVVARIQLGKILNGRAKGIWLR